MPRYVGRSSCIRVFPIANIPNEHARRLASKMHMEVVVPDSLRERVIENIRFGELIAQGANGTITEGKWEGSIVAVKKIHSVFNEPSEFDFKLLQKRFFEDCKQSFQLRHANLVQLLGIFIPSGAIIPSLVMERLYCNLDDLLGTHADIPLEIKLNLLHGTSLGLRYLHSRSPPIIHQDLTSKNILVSKGMEAKIAHLSTVRFANQSLLTSLSLDTQDFMPPEAITDIPSSLCGAKLDVFSFGCVILHTFSHRWPSPQNIISDSPGHPHTEMKRRSQYLKAIPITIQDELLPIIKTCLDNDPGDRPHVANVSDQLESIISNRKLALPESTLHLQLILQEAKREIKDHTVKLCTKGAELHSKNAEVEKLKAEISKLNTPDSATRKVSKSSSKFWSSIELKWQFCTDLPAKCWVTSAVELDGNVYATIEGPSCCYSEPIMYEPTANKWFILPSLPCNQYSLAVVPNRKHLLAIGGKTVNVEFMGLSNRVFLWDEKYRKWLNPYPDMPTARLDCSSVGYQSSVIVAGGVTCLQPWTISRVVEVLQVNDSRLSDSIWSRVEPLPHVVHEAVPLIVGEKVFFAVGYDEHRGSTSTIVAANLPALLYEPMAFQAWEKIPDMPYSCPCITYYEDRLITFGGDGLVERPDEDTPVWEFFPPINMYNPDAKSWDHVGDIPHGYYLGKSVHLSDNQILFIGGLVGKLCVSDESLLTTCSLLTIANKNEQD